MIEKKKNKLTKIYIVAVIILLIFLHYLNMLNFAEKSILNLLASIQNQNYVFFTKLKYSFINYQEAQDLKKQNIELQKQVNQLIYDNSQLINYKNENEKLRSILNFHEDKDFNYILAKVIGKDLVRSNALLINKGRVDGIVEGYSVTVDNGIMIGKIVEVKDYFSVVLLLTDNSSQLAISTLDSQKTTGLAHGEFGLSLKVDYIPQDIEVKEGDIIITSGQEKNIPRGLIIGKINRLISFENELFKSATISLLTNYDEINIVSIIIPKSY